MDQDREFEKWLPIKDFENLYMISSWGRIGSIANDVIMKPQNSKGYKSITLYKNGQSYKFAVHILVAEHFIEKVEGKDIVNHKDGNKSNNYFDNLEWMTIAENTLHSYYDLKKGIKPIEMLDLNGNFLKEFPSASLASREMNITRSNIVSCLKGTTHTAGGYKWKYKQL